MRKKIFNQIAIFPYKTFLSIHYTALHIIVLHCTACHLMSHDTSAEPDFFRILCQICLGFRHILPQLIKGLPKFTKAYQSLPNLPIFLKSLPNFTDGRLT